MAFRPPLFLGALLLETACRLNAPVIGQTADPRSGRDPSLGAEVTLEVMTKQPPYDLIARDGSTCRVAPDVFASARVGSMFRCPWVKPYSRGPVQDPSVVVVFQDTTPTMSPFSEGATYTLRTSADRESLRAMIKRERALWTAARPQNYRFLLRVDCFCPGPRGWQLIQVRGVQAVQAWDKTGQPATLNDWNTVSIDALYDNLERSVDGDGVVQIVFDPRWHFPTHLYTNAARVPDSWGDVRATRLRPL